MIVMKRWWDMAKHWPYNVWHWKDHVERRPFGGHTHQEYPW